ncbi:TetR/AcrR family transcriptional regulator [Salisaeta longa]|uniref:TetR/AcrR family transcriptional regulator n=1 Tax=Salisaeta longa TaxID=503170 RepID=UPI0003FFAFF2|nr:TetR/AcrR family transcriptional regulator [Salisaeta longa]
MSRTSNGSASDALSRRERERRARRHAMLDAARAVFAEKGYARATIDEIATRAEFGKGTLYNYFDGGKEAILYAIFDELYDDVCDLLQTSFNEAAVEENGLRAAFREFVKEAFSFFRAREDLFLILTKEAYRLAFSEDPERAAYFRAQQERMVGMLVPVLEQAMEAGTIRTLPPRSVAHMLLENVNGMVVHRCLTERMQQAQSEDLPSVCTPSGLLDRPSDAADFVTAMLFDGLQL